MRRSSPAGSPLVSVKRLTPMIGALARLELLLEPVGGFLDLALDLAPLDRPQRAAP
jgi:hypothetical protein